MAQSNGNAQDKRPSVLAGTISTIVIATLFVSARMLTRLWIMKRPGFDDGWILFAWTLAFGLSFSICYGTSKGLGLHSTDIPKEWLPQLGPSIYAFTVLYYPSVLVTKISVLALYLRIFRHNKFISRGSVAILITITCAYIALTCEKIFRCQPVSAAWQLAPTGTVTCVDIVVIHLASTPVNVLTDLAIILLPIPILTSLRLPRRQKIMLVLTFLLAAFDVIVCIVRIAFLERALLRATVRNRLEGSSIPVDSDITYIESSAFMWSAVEVNIGIVCACIITLKPLVARVFPWILEGSRRESDCVGRTYIIPESPAPNMTVNTTHFRSVSYSSTAYSAQAGDNPDLEFITTPEMTNISSYTGRALIPQEPRLPSRRLFESFNISLASKCLINLSAKESYLPIAVMTILSFLLKFAYEVMTIHAAHILPILPRSQLRGVQFQATYFCGYFVGPLSITQYTLKKFSFHTSLLAGLLIFAIAPMIFWPSIILLSVPGLIVSYLVLGLGLSAVFNVIFTFVSLCGPFQYSVIRFLFSQGVGNIGQLLSFILTAQYFFPANPSETAILNSQWAFLAISLFFVFLAVFLFYIYLPDVCDEDLIRDAEYIVGVRQRCMFPWRKETICKWDVVYTTLALGVFSAFCYSGVNSVVTYFFPDYVRSMTPTSGLKDYHVAWIAGSTLIIGQFVTAVICYYVRSSWVLLLWCFIYIILSTLTITVEGTSGVVIIVVQQLFESSIFPLLFTISLNGLGRHTKAASAYLTATLSAGALFIPVTYFVQKHPSANPIQYSFCVVLACSCFGLVMPLFINISRAASKQVNRLRQPLTMTDSSE